MQSQVYPTHDTLGHDGAALFAPSPADERWRAAAALRGIWTFTRADRLTALKTRAENQRGNLLRERCEVGREGDAAAVARLDARLLVLQHRARKFQALARAGRRAERRLESRIAGWHVEDYTLSPATASLLARHSLVGHD